MSVATPWMTTEDPFCSHDQTLDGTVNFQSLKCILGTTGVVPAGFRQCRGNDPLVDLDGKGKQDNEEPAYPPDQEELINVFR